MEGVAIRALTRALEGKGIRTMRRLGLAYLIIGGLLAALPAAAAKRNTDRSPRSYVPPEYRPVLAVVAFDDGSIQRQSWWGRQWDVGSGLADVLVSTLLDRGRFRLLERSQLRKVLAEQDLGASGRVDPATAARAARIIGADYLIMGKVTDFSWQTNGGSSLLLPRRRDFFGLGLSQTTARVGVDLRIVDASTAEILGSYSGRARDSKASVSLAMSRVGAFDIGSRDFMNSILGSATRRAMADWTDQV